MKRFKAIKPRFYKNDKEFAKGICTLRVNVYSQLKKQEYALGLNKIDMDEETINIMNLGQLVHRVLRSGVFKKELVHSEFKPKLPSEDILYDLVGIKGNSIGVRDLNNMELILNEYDYMFNNPRFYFNTRGDGPLRTYQVSDLTIIFRGYSEQPLLRFLNNVSYDLGDYFSFSEPYFIGFTSSFRLKEEIVLRYCRHEIRTFNIKEKEYQDIMSDAYNDLRRITSINCIEEKDRRLKEIDECRDLFYENLVKSLYDRKYTPYILESEFEWYSKLIKEYVKGFNCISQSISHHAHEMPYDIESYYVFDQPMSNCNKLKIDYGYIKNQVMTLLEHNKVVRSIITQIHPDVVTGIFLLMNHLKLSGLTKLYYRGSSLVQLISLFISSKLRCKPLIIKMGLKKICDGLLHDMKERGLVTCHQLENFFGYRVGVTIIDEVKADYLNWFNKGIEKFSDIQYDFIRKWAPSFFKSLNYKGRRIGEIINENLSHYSDFESIIGNEYQYMTGHGVVGDLNVKSVDGKNRSISKNMFFKIYKDPQEVEADIDKYSKRNKVIIKREELIKQRIVINSTLGTFLPLSKVNKFLSVTMANTGMIYVFNNKNQKADNYVRLNNYLLYNKTIRNRYICLPLDYSSYDHTITIGFIKAVLSSIGDYCGYSLELMKLYDEFVDRLGKEVIYFKELGNQPDNNQPYKYGMLSGWKITSSVESIGNAILTYGVMNELGLNLIDLETMGDDLIIILEAERLERDDQLKLLSDICEFYNTLGFEMNVPKNSIGYYFLEFLRVTFRPGSIQCYPTRILGSLVYLKPGREESNFSIVEVQSVIRKICKRYGVHSRYVDIAKYYLPSFNREDIRKYGVSYVMNKGLFSLRRVEKEKYAYKIDDIRKTPIYKFYTELVGEEYGGLIEDVINHYMVKKIVTLTYIEPRGKSTGFDQNQINFLKYICEIYRKQVNSDLSASKLYIPDYHLGIIVIRLIKMIKSKGLDYLKSFLMEINKRLFSKKLIRLVDYNKNVSTIVSISDSRDAISRIETDRILVDERNIPSLVLSKVKKDFINFLHTLLSRHSLSDFGRGIVKSIISKNKNYIIREVLGELLSSKSEIIAAFDGLPIGWMCD